MKLITVYSAQRHPSGNIDMQIRAELEGVETDIPFGYRSGDPHGLGPELDAWWALNPQFPVADAPVLPPPDYPVIDQETLNAALAEPGSVLRALALLTFQEINTLRTRGGLTAYTMAQFTTALKAKMRNGA